ncbi:Sugar phosphate isomerase/epimerase [Loktanella fryxellensis]|uniref:Sugar phosphate isomerase/epimerase n=1 Tax=Loktanella fryxellensis TaxID=245187 RepID=A0A1H8CC44_9RHOB|nr:sugar phosphate isomerase/epimerase family protein [Loktanella fryxellensis]SEM91677.1 Sugar phosphate isomerase/epimerase [Loktanella fryxellensis]
MQIGCCTWIFGGEPLADTAARLRAAGLDGVELFGDVTQDADDVRRTLDAQGLEVFCLTPGDADIAHPDAGVRAAGLDYYRRLVDFAAAVGSPLLSCHGQVGRIAPIGTQAEEDAHLIASVTEICAMADRRGLRVVFEILNRYETHQVRTVAQGLALCRAVGADNLSLLADAYHMNIEEADPAGALRQAGSHLGLYHVADSNREGVRSGHTDFAAHIAALRDVGYAGPVILETNAPGPNPFRTDKGAGFRDVLTDQLRTSAAALRAM